MWISKARYTELVKAETRSEWLTVHVNRLELDLANARAQITGQPQLAPMIHRAAATNTPKPVSPDTDDFTDMGDEQALKHGARWSENGDVIYES